MEKDSSVYKIRHTLSHVLADAVLELYPHAQCGSGPATETGFFYGFDFSAGDTPGEEDLKQIEKKMRHLLKQSVVPEQETIALAEALERFKDSPYKTEILKEKGEKSGDISVFTIGKFADPCSGPHVAATKEIDVKGFRLERIAGAYWKGDEKNPMLTRIYGVAFETAEELAEYDKMQKEAKDRDHRKIGKELGLFTFSETVGKGLPLYTHKGSVIRRELERFIIDEEIKRGYLHVTTPDIAKLALYEKSGHYPHYKDSMYAPIKVDDDEFMLRPMTCPHHFELYLAEPHSYKELPMRIGEMAKLYRYEQSGELNGLIRVRSFCLADAHIICADEEQAAEEVSGALDLIEYVASVFGLKMGEDYWYQLSLGDRTNTEKYYDNDAAWDTGEDLLRKLLQKRDCAFVEAPDEGAFYGPKIDVQMKNVNGKEDTAFTVQYDFCMPDRFDLTYTAPDGSQKRAFVVHRSSIGAIERIMAFIIEHYAGNFPLWLAPEQVAVIPVAENHVEYATKVSEQLKELNIRVHADMSDESMGKKIRYAKKNKLPYFIVIGDKEIESETVTLEARNGDTETLSLEDLTARLSEEVRAKKLT